MDLTSPATERPADPGARQAPAWDDCPLVPAPTARRLQLGNRTVLFCEHQQQLYELNSAADAIWLALAAERSALGAARALSGQRANDEVLGFVRQAAFGWIRGGQLVPAPVLDLLGEAPNAELRLTLDEFSTRVRLYGEIDAQAIRDVFGQFEHRGAVSRTLSIAAAGGLVFMFDGHRPLGAFEDRSWIPTLKAWLTERYAESVRGAFLAHGALLSRGGKGLLITGDPGAGKTTLTVALTAAGFGYHADDIVRIGVDGRATGAPFSPAVKTGAWKLLEEIAPELSRLPSYVRSDSQDVRYLPLTPAPREPLPIAAIVLLGRQPEGEARFNGIEPLEALTTLLASAYSASHSIGADALQALASSVNRARCGRLSYSRLEPAVRVLSALCS
ncbi:MAG TPA: hypothetical protein VD906_00910 [Caulobacteraceae bacterium]|nr:hypothetical protein [Caulobacteraceae bacterium]